MATMNAAVVSSFERPPQYGRFAVPVPREDGQELVDVLAAGLHPRVRSGARGAHYTSTGTLPMVPGVDGVGRRADGALVYFVADDDATGTMAEKALLDPRRAIELPDGVDVAAVAAAMNPAMSSWVALRRRTTLMPGQAVLVLGATGNAGAMAVQVARRLGAGRVLAAGRDATRLQQLSALGADEIVCLRDGEDAERGDSDLAAVAAEVDVVIDYLWGEPARRAMLALLTARADRSRPLDWVQIGAVAGPTLELPSAALRSANLRIQGSGQGSVGPATYLAELPSLVAEIERGTFDVRTRTVALAEVESAWEAPVDRGERIVFVP
ncbi:MAG TPA: zinc-binding alcohol dehydrogenase family protein [Solirubrobacteraceae bacterium]|nr:zinc-binding alcohol dehydrogenase family protein [Solirubrobacteraceae bacterium]